MNCIAIQHVLFENLGTFEEVLKKRGFEIRFHQAGVDLPEPSDFLASDLAVILGGPIGANDEADYPFIADELKLAESRIGSGKPILGICLGAQLIARAMGAKVYPNKEKEICWSPLSLSAEGLNSPLKHLSEAFVLHWHGDTFDLPEGSALLASTQATKNQAFQIGKHVLALQFHPEADCRRLEQWLVWHACELNLIRASPGKLRAGGLKYGEALKEKGALFFAEWLSALSL